MKSGLKKKIALILGIVFGICLIAGVVFAVMRPAYIQEAVQILFENDMNQPLPVEEPPEPEKPDYHFSDEVKHQGPGQTVPRTPVEESLEESLEESSEEDDD